MACAPALSEMLAEVGLIDLPNRIHPAIIRPLWVSRCLERLLQSPLRRRTRHKLGLHENPRPRSNGTVRAIDRHGPVPIGVPAERRHLPADPFRGFGASSLRAIDEPGIIRLVVA